jgi:hypothetical protein
MRIGIEFEDESAPGARRCGGCTLCCKLLPMQSGSDRSSHALEAMAAMVEHGLAQPRDFDAMMPAFDKPAGAKCPHQSHHRGCKVYDRRPFGCRYWNCRWLTRDDTDDQNRPDRSHYVIDLMPDFITVTEDDVRTNIEVVQVWIDPDYREAHRDPALRAYLARRGKDGVLGLIRFSSHEGFVLIPPAMTTDGRWIEKQTDKVVPERQPGERIAGIASASRKVVVK